MKKTKRIFTLTLSTFILASCSTTSIDVSKPDTTKETASIEQSTSDSQSTTESSTSSEQSSETTSENSTTQETTTSNETTLEESTSEETTSEETTSEESTSEETSSSQEPTTSEETSSSTVDLAYYSSISDSFTGGINGTLRQSLTKLIKPKSYYTYKGSKEGTLGYELQYYDEDPTNKSNMILFYSQKSIKKELSSAGHWNREHCWPQSLSGGLYGTDNAGADILHIRPTYNETNSARGNLKYGNAKSSNKVYTYSSNGSILSGYRNGTYFEPLDNVKGDAARITLYMYVCYFAERNHDITNNAESIKLMVDWSKMDPPSEIEKIRNDKVQKSKQANRNPFVDHPEWVDKIFA